MSYHAACSIEVKPVASALQPGVCTQYWRSPAGTGVIQHDAAPTERPSQRSRSWAQSRCSGPEVHRQRSLALLERLVGIFLLPAPSYQWSYGCWMDRTGRWHLQLQSLAALLLLSQEASFFAFPLSWRDAWQQAAPCHAFHGYGSPRTGHSAPGNLSLSSHPGCCGQEA